MSRFRMCLTMAAAALAVVAALPSAASAMTLRQGQDITIGRSETINDDVYAFGSSIQIDGNVDGDVVAFGQTVVITGSVTGDVLAAAQTVRITGEVGGSVRAAGSDVSVESAVKGDVLASAGVVRVGSDARVGRDAVLAGGTVTLLGSTGRNAYMGASTVSVQGPIQGNLQASASGITIGSGGKVGGDFEYWSNAKPTVDGTVTGKTIPHAAQTRTESAGQSFVTGLISWVQGTVGWVLFGLLMLLMLPVASGRSATVLTEKPWPSLGIGFAALIVPLIVAIPLFIIGAIIGGWWIVLMALSVWGILVAVGSITGALTIGRLLGGRMSSPPSDLLAMLLGLAIVRVVQIVPFLGGLAASVVSIFGLGALVIMLYRALRGQRGGEPAEEAGSATPAMPATPEMPAT